MISKLSAALTLCAVASYAGGADAQSGGTIIDRDRADRNAPRTESRLAPTERTNVREPLQLISPFVLKDVQIEGSSLPHALFEPLIAPLRGKTIDRAGVVAMVNGAAAVYARSEVALYLIDAPEQDFAGGIVRLRVIEGHIGAVAITGDTGGDIDLARRYAARLTTERPLTRRTMERQFLLLSDIPGLKTTLRMAPGEAPSETVLGLDMKQQRFTWELGIDNRGSPLLGRTQFQVQLLGNGVFRLGDQTALTIGADSHFDRFLYTALTHRQPIGYNGATLQGSVGHLKTTPTNGVRGAANTAGIVFSYPIDRAYQHNLTAALAFDGLDSKNAAFGDLIANEQTRVVRASLAKTRVDAKRSLSLSGTASMGLKAFGAETSDASTDLAFNKFNVFASYNRLLGPVYVLRLAASAQVSGDTLPTSERFALGGTFGRAFAAAELSGDQGFGASAELAWRPRKRGLVSELYGFLDGGEIFTRDRPFIPGAERDLMSSGVGMRLALTDRTEFDLQAAKPLAGPSSGADRDWVLRFGLASRF